MGLEPMISSARGWQYTMLTYIPKHQTEDGIIILGFESALLTDW